MASILSHGEVGQLLHQVVSVLTVGKHGEVVDYVTRADLDAVRKEQVVPTLQMLYTHIGRHRKMHFLILRVVTQNRHTQGSSQLSG